MLRVLRRRGWVLVVTFLVATGCAYVVASHRGETYSAESTAVVAASPNSLLTPDQAITLAGTYAVLIPKDTAVLRSVATRLGTSVPDVRKRISVFNTMQTALLLIDYRGTSAANSVAGATAALTAIAGTYPVSPNIIPGSVGAVQAPTTASASKSVTALVALGAILGIALGALLMVIWERVDPRIDRPEDLSQEVGSPTSPVSAMSQSGVNALVARWKALADHGPSKVALVPVTADVRPDLPNVALRLSQVAVNGSDVQRNGPSSWGNGACEDILAGEDLTQPIREIRDMAPVMIVCEVPSPDLTALKSIMECDLVVLVARRGTSRAALRESLDSLTEFGVSPKWAIFLGPSLSGLPPGRTATR
jgi:capsular polysaccharide biosynthesis protein